MIRQPKTERQARATSKTLDHAMLHQLQHDFDCSPFESRAILAAMHQTFQNQWRTPDFVKPGQMVVSAVAAHEPAGKPLADCQMKPILVTVHDPADDALRTSAGRRAIACVRRGQIQRVATEALSQDTYLTVEDLADRILNCGRRTLVRDLKALRTQGIEVPLRGQQCDIGRSITHKVHAVQLALQRKTPTQIARAIHHSLPSVERYLRDFVAVATLTVERYEVATISFLRQISPALVQEYQALYQKMNVPAQRLRLAELIAGWGQEREKKAARPAPKAASQRKRGH